VTNNNRESIKDKQKLSNQVKAVQAKGPKKGSRKD